MPTSPPQANGGRCPTPPPWLLLEQEGGSLPAFVINRGGQSPTHLSQAMTLNLAPSGGKGVDAQSLHHGQHRSLSLKQGGRSTLTPQLRVRLKFNFSNLHFSSKSHFRRIGLSPHGLIYVFEDSTQVKFKKKNHGSCLRTRGTTD